MSRLIRLLDPPANASWQQRYAIAVIAIASVALLRLLLDPWLGNHMVYAVLLIGIMVAAWHGGTGPGVLATVLGLVTAPIFDPIGPVATPLLGLSNGALVRAELFVLLAAIVVWIGQGSRNLRIDALRTADELGRRAAELNRLNDSLEQRVAERTRETEQRTLQLRRLSAELIHAEQNERRRLAQVLHDSVQQLLVAAKMRAGGLTLRADEATRQELEHIDRLLAQSIEVSRSLTVELFPPVLQDRGLVPALHWLARQMHDKHKLRVTVDIDDAAQPRRDDVGVLLFNVARELLFNVVKHARVDHATLSLQRSGNTLLLEVDDRGAGMNLPQLHEAGPEIGGIGLFNIRERLHLLGGALEIVSRPGFGTRVRVVVTEAALPRLVTNGHAPTGAGATRQAERQLRVLLADDHKIVRDGLMTLLAEQPDIDVIGEAGDGETAVELTLKLRPDVVIMDVTMPRLDGIEATRRIVRACPETCVIGLSMHDRDAVGPALTDAGAASFVPKASATDTLLQAIRRCGATTAVAEQ
jgi:signal transduction histidine kinase/CheY-like chemotaxis protein